MHLYTWLCTTAGESSYWCKAFAPEHFADWTAVAFTAAGLLVLIIGSMYAKRTLHHVRLQTKTLQDQLAWTDRAWLKVTATAPEPLRYRNGVDSRESGFLLPVKIEIENVGHSVAVDVDTLVEMEYVPPRSSVPQQLHRRLDDLVALMRDRSSSEAATLFPGARITIDRTVFLSDAQLSDAYAREQGALKMPEQATISLFLIGCCGYRLSADGRPRISSFGYLLMHRLPGQSKLTGRFVITELGALEDENQLVGLHEAFRAD